MYCSFIHTYLGNIMILSIMTKTQCASGGLMKLEYVCYLYTIADKSALKSWSKIPEHQCFALIIFQSKRFN